jgi:hypothetical protein
MLPDAARLAWDQEATLAPLEPPDRGVWQLGDGGYRGSSGRYRDGAAGFDAAS